MEVQEARVANSTRRKRRPSNPECFQEQKTDLVPWLCHNLLRMDAKGESRKISNFVNAPVYPQSTLYQYLWRKVPKPLISRRTAISVVNGSDVFENCTAPTSLDWEPTSKPAKDAFVTPCTNQYHPKIESYLTKVKKQMSSSTLSTVDAANSECNLHSHPTRLLSSAVASMSLPGAQQHHTPHNGPYIMIPYAQLYHQLKEKHKTLRKDRATQDFDRPRGFHPWSSIFPSRRFLWSSQPNLY